MKEYIYKIITFGICIIIAAIALKEVKIIIEHKVYADIHHTMPYGISINHR